MSLVAGDILLYIVLTRLPVLLHSWPGAKMPERSDNKNNVVHFSRVCLPFSYTYTHAFDL